MHRFFWAAHHSAAQHAGHMYSTSTLICRSRSTPPSPFKKGSAVSALSCSRNYDLRSIATRVFRSELPGAWASQNQKLYPNPARPRSVPYDICGHPSWPKEASRRANALHCLHPAFTSGTASAGRLRPQAEFARASGRGLRRVKNVVQDAKGMCKKTILFLWAELRTVKRDPDKTRKTCLFYRNVDGLEGRGKNGARSRCLIFRDDVYYVAFVFCISLLNSEVKWNLISG
jgi:hypothetical protein